MAYSSESELRANIGIATTANISSAIVSNRIAQADKIIKTELTGIVDFSLMPTTYSDNTFPYFVNLLSQYKTAELCLIYLYGNVREEKQNADVKYWKKMFDDLLIKVTSQEISIELANGISIETGDGRFENDARPNTEPALGTGKWSDFLNKDDLYNERPVE